MKTCSKCTNEKYLSEFRRDKSKPDGYAYHCKMCQSERHKELYTEKYHIKAKQRNSIRHEKSRKLMAEYLKDKCCIKCKEDDPVAFDFHHLDPSQKDFQIGTSLNRKWENVLREIEKCVILCANCHRKVHHGSLII